MSSKVINNLASLGYEKMTPVQSATLIHSLSGKDVLAQAKTGSGKTAAFGISLLPVFESSKGRKNTQALIICPTRELADQVAKEIRKLARCVPDIKVLTLCGGTPLAPQAASLLHGAHCIVGTPGRIQDHLRKRTLNLRSVRRLVLDEADRMLDMGFSAVLEEIIGKMSKDRQTLMFSATFPESVKSLCTKYQKEPVQVKVDSSHNPGQIIMENYRVADSNKPDFLEGILRDVKPESAVIFCNTKAGCKKVAENLQRKGYSALSIHGDLEQRERDLVIALFRNKSCPFLVATNVVARGLDIKNLEMVINYELSRDFQEQVHRSGRTGRAGKKGRVISLLSDRELHRLQQVQKNEDVIVRPGKPEAVNTPETAFAPGMQSVRIEGGKRHKLRPGDILGALTANSSIKGSQIGLIDIFDFYSLVAVENQVADLALRHLCDVKIKGKHFKARKQTISGLI